MLFSKEYLAKCVGQTWTTGYHAQHCLSSNFSVSVHQTLLESPVSFSAYQELKTSTAGIKVLLLCWTQEHTCIMENKIILKGQLNLQTANILHTLTYQRLWNDNQFNSFHLVPCLPTQQASAAVIVTPSPGTILLPALLPPLFFQIFLLSVQGLSAWRFDSVIRR